MKSLYAMRTGMAGLVGMCLAFGLGTVPATAKSMVKVPRECGAIMLERPMRDDEIAACFDKLMAMLASGDTGRRPTWRNGAGPGSHEAVAVTKGPTGDAGTDGAAGAPGAPGQTGEEGPTGASGLNGPAGDDGLQGATGDAGPTGATGDTGPEGPQGLSSPF